MSLRRGGYILGCICLFAKDDRRNYGRLSRRHQSAYRTALLLAFDGAILVGHEVERDASHTHAPSCYRLRRRAMHWTDRRRLVICGAIILEIPCRGSMSPAARP